MEALGRSPRTVSDIIPGALGQIRANLSGSGRWKANFDKQTRRGGGCGVWALHRDERAPAILEVNTDITDRKRARKGERKPISRLVEDAPLAFVVNSSSGSLR
jgi:hypothetical protein